LLESPALGLMAEFLRFSIALRACLEVVVPGPEGLK